MIFWSRISLRFLSSATVFESAVFSFWILRSCSWVVSVIESVYREHVGQLGTCRIYGRRITYSSRKLAILALYNPLLPEGLALAKLGDGLVANGLLQVRDRQPLHRLAHSLEDAGLMAAVGCNLLCFGFQKDFLPLDSLVGDH